MEGSDQVKWVGVMDSQGCSTKFFSAEAFNYRGGSGGYGILPRKTGAPQKIF